MMDTVIVSGSADLRGLFGDTVSRKAQIKDSVPSTMASSLVCTVVLVVDTSPELGSAPTSVKDKV